MTKAQLIAKITSKINSEKEDTEAVVEAFFKTIQSALGRGDEVFIRGFGTFVIKKRAAKTARNIAKDTILIVPECFKPVFRPAEEFLSQVKAANHPKTSIS